MVQGKEEEYLRHHPEDTENDSEGGGGKTDLSPRRWKEPERNIAEPVPRELLDACLASCTGVEACSNATASIGACSCMGMKACQLAEGFVGDGSCNGELACDNTRVAIDKGSCNGGNACGHVYYSIGTNSCNGGFACYIAHGAVDDGSCNGKRACLPDCVCSPENLCHFFINCGSYLPVGKNSCNGDNACACRNRKGHTKIYDIGDGECNRQGDNFTGELTCCVEGKVFPCECTETPEGGLVVGDSNTCVSIRRGFIGGNLKCNNATCQFDTSECTTCGDGNVKGDEQWKGTEPLSVTCAALGFAGGTLKCNSNTCQFDTSECTPDCIGIWCFFLDIWLAFLSIFRGLFCFAGLCF